MKLDAGWIAATLVAAAGIFGAASQPGSRASLDETASGTRSQSGTVTAARATATGNFEAGPCGELEGTIQTFLWTSTDGIAAPSSCYTGETEAARSALAAKDTTAASNLQAHAASLKFVIAILPDPVHTHFSLGFDRLAESIQQAEQDENYFYDSSWLPWDKVDRAQGGGEGKIDEQTRVREEQPGILLFRKRPKPDGPLAADQPYRDGLAVFIVGEEPTTGIHKRQFENALQWISALQPRAGTEAAAPLRGVSILGPSFSGSLPSLAQLLANNAAQIHSMTTNSPRGKLMIFSGGITSLALVRWFVRLPQTGDTVRFRSFETDGETLLDRYRKYLMKQKFDLARLAIVSEDETAFGGYSEVGKATSGPCAPASGESIGPACLYYPRDISALRDAYQKQSIFSSSKSAQQSTDTSQKTLTTDIADPEGKQHDAIRNYSGNQTALAQEAVLQQIVSMLKAHQSEYVVLRSSNPLDQLFLSHYLRLTYPEGRIVIEGSDLLLRRENGAAALSGIMSLTTYPLLPWEAHWTGVAGTLGSHSHRVFSQEGAEGNYIATRFLMNADCIAKGVDPSAPDQIAASRFLPLNCTKALIPDYAPPFWADPSLEAKPPAVDPEGRGQRPAAWLSVLGRDGFWPVAALTETSLPEGQQSWQSRLGHALWSLPADLQYLLPFGASGWFEHKAGRPAYIPEQGTWPPIPLSMKLCLLALFLASVFHFHCCMRPSLTVKPGHRAHFVRLKGRSHPALLLMGSIALAMVPILMAWGYGAMSRSGEPLAHAWWSRSILPIIWMVAGLALSINILIESQYEEPFSFKRWKKGPRWGRLMVRVLAGYVFTTYLFYCIVDFFLDETLVPANRIPTYWRAINLTTGVSPLVPLVALSAGLYLWFWYSLQGLALLGPDRPLLPSSEQLQIPDNPKAPVEAAQRRFLCMFSEDRTAAPIEDLSHPFSRETLMVAAVAFVVVGLVAYFLAGGVPVRSLGSRDYSILFCLWMNVCISILLANTWQLLRVWLRLRQLLLFLDRIPLRRTMKALKGYSWGSVWKMGGNVLDVRYKLLSRQLEALTHLRNSLACPETPDHQAWCEQLDKTQAARTAFAKWYSRNWDKWNERDLSTLEAFQVSVAETAGMSFSGEVLRQWRLEGKSLAAEPADAGHGESKGKGAGDEGDGGISALLRNAEELICLVYLGFIQNVLARIRTLVMAMLWLFVAATASVATYPFDPRPTLSGAMLALFLTIGVAVILVYSQMHRDATLSYVTDTNPGELGGEFWWKLLGFGLGPALGLMATIFPELPGSLFSWLQPGVASIK